MCVSIYLSIYECVSVFTMRSRLRTQLRTRSASTGCECRDRGVTCCEHTFLPSFRGLRFFAQLSDPNDLSAALPNFLGIFPCFPFFNLTIFMQLFKCAKPIRDYTTATSETMKKRYQKLSKKNSVSQQILNATKKKNRASLKYLLFVSFILMNSFAFTWRFVVFTVVNEITFHQIKFNTLALSDFKYFWPPNPFSVLLNKRKLIGNFLRIINKFYSFFPLDLLSRQLFNSSETVLITWGNSSFLF